MSRQGWRFHPLLCAVKALKQAAMPGRWHCVHSVTRRPVSVAPFPSTRPKSIGTPPAVPKIHRCPPSQSLPSLLRLLASCERLNAGDGPAQNQRVDVVGACGRGINCQHAATGGEAGGPPAQIFEGTFIGVDGLQVQQVPDDVVLVANPVAPQHVAGLTGDFQRFAA